MGEAKTRKYHTPEYKAKVGLEALRGLKTINEIGQEYGVHPVQVGQWKKEIQEQASKLFEGKRGPKPTAERNGNLKQLKPAMPESAPLLVVSWRPRPLQVVCRGQPGFQGSKSPTKRSLGAAQSQPN